MKTQRPKATLPAVTRGEAIQTIVRFYADRADLNLRDDLAVFGEGKATAVVHCTVLQMGDWLAYIHVKMGGNVADVSW